MPLSVMPNDPKPVSYKLRQVTKSFENDSHSLRLSTRKIGGQRWEGTIVFPPMYPSEFAPILTFLEDLGGRNAIFGIELPDIAGSPGFVVGNFVNANTHDKLYRIKSVGAVGAATSVSVASGLVGTVPAALDAGANLTITSQPVIRVSLASDVIESSYGDDGFVRYEIDVKERI